MEPYRICLALAVAASAGCMIPSSSEHSGHDELDQGGTLAPKGPGDGDSSAPDGLVATVGPQPILEHVWYRGQPLPDGDPAGLSQMVVLDHGGIVVDFFVTFSINHPRPEEIEVMVQHDGRGAPFIYHPRSQTDLTGSIPVPAFRGEPANGGWTVSVSDIAGGGEVGAAFLIGLYASYDTSDGAACGIHTAAGCGACTWVVGCGWCGDAATGACVPGHISQSDSGCSGDDWTWHEHLCPS